MRLRRRLYTVLTDGKTGHAVALVEGGKEQDVVRELNRREFDRHAVKIIVSDLGKTNIAIAKKEFGHALHVADKWHVLKGANDALSKVINQEVNKLRKSGKQDQAKAIVAVKRLLMRGQTEIRVNGFQLALGLNKAAPVLMQHPRIGRAFWAKMRLYRAYQSKSSHEAIKHGIRFFRRARSETIEAEFKELCSRLWNNHKIILNYFVSLDVNGNKIQVSNGPTERANSDIRAVLEGRKRSL